MPAATSPIFPNVPIIGIASVVSATPVTSRAPIVGTTGLVKLTDTSAPTALVLTPLKLLHKVTLWPQIRVFGFTTALPVSCLMKLQSVRSLPTP
jgi:hypothetical protein